MRLTSRGAHGPRPRARLLAPAMAALLLLVPTVGHGAAARPQELADVLQTLGRVSALYGDSALSFACVERISQTRFRSLDRIDTRTSHTFDYFYVFNTREDVDASGGQLRVGLQDYRTRSGAAADGTAEHINPADLGVAHLSRAYSWVFIFGTEASPNFIFIQEPDGEALGRPAYLIGFEPRLPIRPGLNDWSGRAWVDKETMQLLRVEAVTSAEFLQSNARAAQLRAEGGLNMAMTDDNYGFLHAEVEFGIDKNGLRFPSQALLTGTLVRLEQGDYAGYQEAARELLDRGIRMDRTFRVEQSYRDYRFFSVRTAIEVEERIRGQGGAGAD